jgi:hypothetical protein
LGRGGLVGTVRRQGGGLCPALSVVIDDEVIQDGPQEVAESAALRVGFLEIAADEAQGELLALLRGGLGIAEGLE